MWRRLLQLSAVVATTAERVVVPLDLGWRTSIAPAPACSYPLVLPNLTLGNSGWIPSTLPSSAAACEAAACAANTQAWSFCSRGECGAADKSFPRHKGPGPWCIIGSAGRVEPPEGAKWTTKARDTSHGPASTAPQVQRSFDDSAWNVVDLPHDASNDLPYSPDADGPEQHGAGRAAPPLPLH